MRQRQILVEAGLLPVKFSGAIVHLTRRTAKRAEQAVTLCDKKFAGRRYSVLPANAKVTCEGCIKELLHVVAMLAKQPPKPKPEASGYRTNTSCPNCDYPNPNFKGIYTPGHPCPQCRRVEAEDARNWRTPSRAARECAKELLTPPPEFQMLRNLIDQNTAMLEQTARTLELLVQMVTAKQKR